MKLEAEYLKVRKSLDNLAKAKQELRDLHVIRSERLVGEIGEWFFTALYGGERAKSSTQKDWDIVLDGKKIQIKTHAKGDKNNARWSVLKFNGNEFDELVIIVLSKEFYLKEFFRVEANFLSNLIEKSGDRTIIKWDKLSNYKIKVNNLPNEQIIKSFTL